MKRFGSLLPRLQQARGLLGQTAWPVQSGACLQSFGRLRGYADDANLLKTPLFDFHVENGGNSRPEETKQNPV
jgi:hypothetical protein